MRLGIFLVFGISAIMFALGFAAAYLIYIEHDHPDFAIREYDERYQYIRRLLICQINEGEESREFSSLERRVEDVLDNAERLNKIISASVYVRELDTGKWMGVNEDAGYAPASLLKVPIMISYLRYAQDDPNVLEREYRYELSEEPNDLVAKPLLISGRTYSVLDLVRGMIIQSDNDAKTILEKNADWPSLDATYGALGIKDPYKESDDQYTLSVKQYGLFFRVLYNGTFLSREMSNRALEMLAESEFNLGLRAGIPEGVEIAHKYGVSGYTRDDGTHGVDLSDCGVVYEPTSPYLVCVMTHGDNAYVLADVIKDIAEVVHQGIITER
jgi:beta-lactamase class A